MGYENGPQVPDPAVPQDAPQLAAHERWWDIVWKAQHGRGIFQREQPMGGGKLLSGMP
jgi:hypothetical protein